MFLGLKTLITIMRKRKGETEADQDALDKAIAACGYAYDIKQDMFYSTIDAWQRKMGYCRLYDESAAPTGMIVDCEPLYFEYKGKRWLIELWKGQYDLCTGCEIGVYTCDWTTLPIPLVYKNLFYHCASDEEMLKMRVALIKDGTTLFEREAVHWWMTGFKLGEFSNPTDLLMKVSITLKDTEMRNAFVQTLKKADYKANEIIIDADTDTVSFTFNKPHASQPLTRTRMTDWAIQLKNKYLCDTYQDLSKPVNSFTDALIVIMVQVPEIYKNAKNLLEKKQ
jgi:hypothetical protein